MWSTEASGRGGLPYDAADRNSPTFQTQRAVAVGAEEVPGVRNSAAGRVDASRGSDGRCREPPVTRLLTPAGPDLARRPVDVVFVTAGLAVLLAGMAFVGDDGWLPSWEVDLFRAINDLPGGLYPVLWPIQQLGAFVAGPIVALIAWLAGRRRLALAALFATVAKMTLERVVKAIVSRQRPATSIGPDIETRGAIRLTGESFVSGHAVMAAAVAAVVAPWLPGRWRVAPWILVGLAVLSRVYVGAHNPLDVVCGAALGLAIGGGVNLLLGVPEPSG
jgi:membrane-associated phospholipid phosphatase